jgi:hypothetical protein
MLIGNQFLYRYCFNYILNNKVATGSKLAVIVDQENGVSYVVSNDGDLCVGFAFGKSTTVIKRSSKIVKFAKFAFGIDSDKHYRHCVFV